MSELARIISTMPGGWLMPVAWLILVALSVHWRVGPGGTWRDRRPR